RLRALATVREFYFTEPVENLRRYQPFAIRLAFLDPFVGRQDFLRDFNLQQRFTARALVVVEWPIRHPNAGPYSVCQITACVVTKTISEDMLRSYFSSAMVDGQHFFHRTR